MYGFIQYVFLFCYCYKRKALLPEAFFLVRELAYFFRAGSG
jgi:hypothetical protein